MRASRHRAVSAFLLTNLQDICEISADYERPGLILVFTTRRMRHDTVSEDVEAELVNGRWPFRTEL